MCIYFTQFSLEWEMFKTKVVEKIKTHDLCSVPFHKNRDIYEIMWKYGRDRQVTDDNIIWRITDAMLLTEK